MQPQEPVKVPIRVRELQRKAPVKRKLGAVLYGGWIAAFAIGGTFWGFTEKSPVAIEVIKSYLFNVKPEDTFDGDSINILLLGCDEDLAPGGLKVLKQAGRADMIMLAHLDFKKKTITGVSIPRDTKCQLPGQPAHKLNAYHNLAKPEEAKQKQQEAVEYLTGVKVDKTIVLDYVAFQDLVDSVGGITVTIKDKMDYDDNAGMLHVHFVPGVKKLNGYDAMCYVRFRKDTGGDFKRTERQRQLITAFKGEVVKNWTNLPNIIQKGVMVLGEDTFSDKEVAGLAIFAKGVAQKDIKMLRLPTVPGRGSFEELDRKAAKDMLRTNGFLSTNMSADN
jgi:polyisoprenyl-teichoic acid--peptidoglycan teichoic acid transferase